jgi:hypothetical protein
MRNDQLIDKVSNCPQERLRHRVGWRREGMAIFILIFRERVKDIARSWAVGPEGIGTLYLESARLPVTVFRFSFDFPL